MNGGPTGGRGEGCGSSLTSGSNLTRACSARAERAWFASLAHVPALSLGGVLISNRFSPRFRPVSQCGPCPRWLSAACSTVWYCGNRLEASESIIIGEGLRAGGGSRLISSKDSIPGRRIGCCCIGGPVAGTVTVSGGNWDGVITWLNLLAPL